ncbi:cation:proton antiporter [Altericista sp. CCNU0014]|uniref:cation:proton antiporter n=1 Tax=Altericista sp. CCNU0014 TaxID=3082949 RepID=UPI00384E845F
MTLESPIIAFSILIATILLVPPIFERLRLPGLIGLLIAGVVLGQSGLRLLSHDSETVKLLSEVGKVYLMFVAGLEIDLEQFRKTRNRSIGFGLLTFLVPLLTGIAIGQMFGFSWNASLLIGSLLASHTLLAYPIVSRLGVVNNEAVTVTIGATIFTDTGALLVLAICVGIHQGEFTALNLASLLIGLVLYSATVLFGFDWAGKEFFRRSGDQEGKQFLFILLALFVASVGAQAIGVEKIVGAFLAGLAVNDVLGRSPSREKVEFVGSVLFIPCFFVDMGLLIDIPAFIKTLSSIGLTVAIVVGLIGSKFVAALLAKLLYRYTRDELLTMWSLSLPQVAATLAATLVAYQTLNPAGERLVNENVLNSVIVLMVVTSIAGPLITARVASLLPQPQPSAELEPSIWWESQTCDITARSQMPFTIIVPLYNPQTQRYLIEMAALLARNESGKIVTLTIARSPVHMDNPQLDRALAQSQRMMEGAAAIGREFGIAVTPKVRIDDDIALGISRASREENASLIVMGWSRTSGFRARLFGNAINSVFWSSHCPVAVARLLSSPTTFKQILVPIESLSPQALRMIQFAQLLAANHEASVTLLHVCDRRIPPGQIAQFEVQLFETAANPATQVKTIVHDDIAKAIVQEAKYFDLTILHAVRQRTAAGLAVSDVTTRAIDELTGSMVILGEPKG